MRSNLNSSRVMGSPQIPAIPNNLCEFHVASSGQNRLHPGTGFT
jgi:hypothetical protein